MTEKVKPDFTMIGLSSGVPTLDDIIALAKHLTGKDLSPECIAELKAQMVRDGYPTDEASSLLASNPS